MASAKDTATFFSQGTSTQFEQVLALYPQALRLKADAKAKKAEELIKLDNWYQNELPKKIKSRGKDAHLVHEELVQCMKWKQSRGKFFPQLSYLVKVNTPRMVILETKKAFKKLPHNLEQAITALINLKGVGTTMASALLAAASPETAAFMADECLMAIPEIEGIDYTTKEYLKFAQHIRNTVDRLNKGAAVTGGVSWTPHKVELAVWTHFVVTEMKPDLLSDAPVANGTATTTLATSASAPTSPLLICANGENSLDAACSSTSSNSSGSNHAVITSSSADECSNDNHLCSNSHPLLLKNGGSKVVDDDNTNTTTATSYTEDDSMDTNAPAAVLVPSLEGDETNDSIVSDSTTNENSGSAVGEVRRGDGAVAMLKRPRPDDVNVDAADDAANDAAPIPLLAHKRPRPDEDNPAHSGAPAAGPAHILPQPIAAAAGAAGGGGGVGGSAADGTPATSQ